jgi:cysteine desulfurase
MEVRIGRLGVDLLTLNAAKVYGPKGIGALYVGHGVKLQPLSVGGGQEMGLRSGTENVPATVGFAAAMVEAEKHQNGERKRLMKLKKILQKELSTIPNIKFLGKEKMQLPSFLPFCVPGVDAERIIFALEDQEIYLSTGAACAASKGIKSPTLKAIGLNDEEIAGSLRISMGRINDEENIKLAGQKIREVISAEIERVSR